jgi:ferredoxin-NADP reductase
VSAMGPPVLLSVNVGLPRQVPWQGKTVYTGIWKYPVDGPAMVRRLNIDGDGQGDTSGHGGEQRAVLVYQIQSYRHWQQHFGRDDFSYGQFGENLTVDGLPDDEVCIGDRYRIGEAEFESPSRESPATGPACGWASPNCPRCWSPTTGQASTCGSSPRATSRPATRSSRPGPAPALSVADTDALLCLPGRDPAKLRLATQIPALSPGWQGSFRDLLAAEGDNAAGALPLGAEPAPRPRPAWAGFRPLRVTKVVPETAAVSSIYLAAPDGSLLPAARPGQYLTLRIPGAGQPAPVRSYSLSSAPDAGTYRISVKQEPRGTASSYLHCNLQPGAVLLVAAPRGDFVLDDGTGPVLLISAGIGVTPVLAMLHQLAAARSERDIWWLHGARGPHEHPFAAEAHALLASLVRADNQCYLGRCSPPRRQLGAVFGAGQPGADLAGGAMILGLWA